MNEPIIREEEGFAVVGLGGRFVSALSTDANNLETIPQLWERFIARLDEVPDRSDGITWGACSPLPADEKRHDDEYRYLAAATVETTEDVPEGMEALRIAPATYAIFTHRGPVTKLGETYAAIHREWLPNWGYRHAPAPELERYDERFNNGEDSIFEIWVPVEKA